MNWKQPLLASLACLAVAPATAQAQLEAVLVAQGFSAPTFLTSPPGDTSRLFIVEQAGRVKIIKDGNVLPTLFLDITSIVLDGGERGLLGLAFHPDYATNRKFYVSYTDNSGSSVLREYLTQASDPDQADASSFSVVFGPLSQPFSNHNGGWIGFSPADGKLYLGLGDGGSANDPSERAQNLGQLLGKMLRFDVDIPFPHVPADNPFTADPTAQDLIWAWGLRNPWRNGFDRQTGDLWIADVGQNAWEEVNFEPAGAGGRNYGWDCMEGNVCTGETPAGGSCTCNAASLTDPVHVYSHSLGCSITGGYRYRGSLMSNMGGRYFFADYCSSRIWSFDFNGTSTSNLVEHTSDLAIPGGENIASFGEDANGELYLVDQNGGQIWLLQDECDNTTATYCQSSPNSNGLGAFITSNGDTSIANNNFVLSVTGSSSSQPGLFYYGDAEIQVPFGNGLRCVGGNAVFRLNPAVVSDFFGDVTRAVDFTVPPAGSGAGAILAGSTWKFQFWYRDPAAGGANFNLSDGLSASFCP